MCCVFLFCLGLWKERTISDKAGYVTPRRSQQLVSTSHSSSHGSCSKWFISREASVPSAQKTDKNGYYNWPICWRMGPPYSVAVPMCSQLKGWFHTWNNQPWPWPTSDVLQKTNFSAGYTMWVWVKTNRGWGYEATNMGMYVEIKWQTNEAHVKLEISPRITDPRIQLFIMTFTIDTVDGAYPPFWIKPYITGWVVSTYPSEKWWTSSVGMIIPFPTEWNNPLKNPWKNPLNHYNPLYSQ